MPPAAVEQVDMAIGLQSQTTIAMRPARRSTLVFFVVLCDVLVFVTLRKGEDPTFRKTTMGRCWWKQQRMLGASAATTAVCSGQDGSFRPSLPSWRALPCSALILPQFTTAASSATSSSTTLDMLGTQIGRIL